MWHRVDGVGVPRSRDDAIDATAVPLTRRDGPDAVRNSSKSKTRPPTTCSPGDDAWCEDTDVGRRDRTLPHHDREQGRFEADLELLS